ncbi:MAG: hypothetical protein JNM83_09585 [Myxococcales bacterium]|nr:hypothetical protein [Myxococcales bacterium]
MSILSDFFNEAGWPIFPTLAFGVAALSIAIKMIDKPTEQLASLVRNLSVLTLLMGMLGTVLGLQHTVRHVEQVEPGMRWIFVVGLRETLNNFDAALLILIPTMLCYTAAMFRLRQDKQ